MSDYGTCPNCSFSRSGFLWCQNCESKNFESEEWTSGDIKIDAFIRDVQYHSQNACQAIDWIPYNELKDIVFIREGGFGKVSSAIWIKGPRNWDENQKKWVRKENHMVALKELKDSFKISDQFLIEIRNHSKCNGLAHIIRCYGLSRNPETKNYIMVMRYAPSGNLRDYLRKNQTLQWKEKLMILLTIADGLKDIHNKGIVHRDFHSGNILLDGNTPYISDLGCSSTANVAPDQTGSVFGVLAYIAPEVVLYKNYSKAADIYSFGCIMWEIVTGKPPYFKYNPNFIYHLKIHKGQTPEFGNYFPQEPKELITKCWDADPSNRPNAREIYESFLKMCRMPPNDPVDPLPPILNPENIYESPYNSVTLTEYCHTNDGPCRTCFSEEQDFFNNHLRITYNTKINGQKKVTIPGLDVYCKVEGNRKPDIELLESLQLHEEEIFNILPTSAIGIGITFVKSYQEPSIILYVNVSTELSEQIIENFFKILQRPPEDIVICQLFDEDKPNNGSKRSNNDNSSKNFEVEKKEDIRERENNSDGNKEENKDSKDDINKGKEYKKDDEGDSNKSQRDDGDDPGEDPNDANATMPYGIIDASASAKITSSNDINQTGQVVTIHFILSMWHPGNKDNKLEFEISKINFSGGEMLSDKFKEISGEGYYPVEAKINFKAYPNCQQDNTAVLITVEESSPYSKIEDKQVSLSKIKGLSAGIDGFNPTSILNLNREKTVREKVPFISISNPNRGFREITWLHRIRNEEKKIPDYSQVPKHKAHFRYAKNFVKEFEVKTELTLEFKKKWFSKELMLRRSRVTKLPAKLRFSLSIIIEEKKIQDIFGVKDSIDCSHPRILPANMNNKFQDSSRHNFIESSFSLQEIKRKE
ncbi:3811_t:CDS:2 [Acaulospora morrowiae]|uniref:3811_t:CDS:1 n=1 Tax=Acaulospora morrowiae TaxID=94023 RepID=A0A9N9DAV3_9GLOM|nr:3811_t:CDS:2 [Acaulospora morrowiae]